MTYNFKIEIMGDRMPNKDVLIIRTALKFY